MQRVSGCKEGEACNEFWGARGSWGGKCCLGGADLYQAGGGGEEACKRRWGRARRRMVQQAGGVQGPGGATPVVSDGSRSCAPTPRSRPRSPFGCQPRRPQPRRAFTQPTVQRCVPSLAAPACAKQSPRAAPRRGRCHQCPPGMGLEQEPPPHPNPGRLFPTIVLESQPRREKPMGRCGLWWLFQGRGFTKGLARLQVCRWWLGFNEDEPIEANERAGGAVEYAPGKTSWRHRCGRKLREGYFLPLACQRAALAA